MENKEGGALSEAGEEAIRTLLLSLKEAMRQEGEGRLDPLALDVQTITHHHPAISLTINLSLMVLKGLSEFRIEEVHLNVQTLTLAISLSCDSLKLEGRYDLKGKLVKVIPVSGSGPFFVTTDHPQVRLRARLHEVRGHLLVLNLKSELDIHGVKTYLRNLPCSSLVSRMLDNVLSETLHREKARLSQELSSSLKELLNNELRNFNLGVPVQILKTGDKLMRRSSSYL
ncbi:UNVERIFIED_CONTAM: hypothetical protein RMT77_007262 [Armadillidium vulgare]